MREAALHRLGGDDLWAQRRVERPSVGGLPLRDSGTDAGAADAAEAAGASDGVSSGSVDCTGDGAARVRGERYLDALDAADAEFKQLRAERNDANFEKKKREYVKRVGGDGRSPSSPGGPRLGSARLNDPTEQ